MSEDLGNGGIISDGENASDTAKVVEDDNKFLALLSDDYKESKIVRKYNSDPNEIIKALEHANVKISELGKNKIAIPESEEEFEFKRIEGDYPFNEDEEKDFRKFMFDNKIPKEYAETVWDMFHKKSYDSFVEQQSASQRRIEAAELKLKSEWGDDYEVKSKAAEKVWEEFADEETTKKIKAKNLAPEIRKALASMYSKVFDESPTVKVPTKAVTTDKATAVQQYEDFLHENLASLKNLRDPKHEVNKRKLHELRQMAFND